MAIFPVNMVYVNDIDNKFKYYKTKLYADDTVLYVSSRNVQLADTMLPADLNRLSQFNFGFL